MRQRKTPRRTTRSKRSRRPRRASMRRHTRGGPRGPMTFRPNGYKWLGITDSNTNNHGRDQKNIYQRIKHGKLRRIIYKFHFKMGV